MPFVPLDPEEQTKLEPPCRDREHNPPTHMVIRNPMKWVCPSCGRSVIVSPTTIFCTVPVDVTQKTTGVWLSN